MMITIKNILNQKLEHQDIILNNYNDPANEINIDGSNLLVLPGLIDPHVHFRVPGLEEKEDWRHGARAAFKGGYTTVFDMPNTKPATTTLERLQYKYELINQQLLEVNLPLKYKLWFGADKNNFQEIIKVKDKGIIGIKVFMGSSTGDLLMDDLSSLHAIYALAKAHNLIIALHAEDELIIQQNLALYKNSNNFADHSKIRSIDASVKAVSLVIELATIYQVPSYILHVSTKEEIAIIAAAKTKDVPIFAETCPHYLFLNDSFYQSLQGKAKMNPPLRSKDEQDYLWQALNDGVIDTIASDHAPHTLEEKQLPLCKCPSGVPGIETTLPLMISSYFDKKISLSKIVDLLHSRAQHIFNLADNDDLIFVDIKNYYTVDEQKLCTKTKWSPFAGLNLTGWPKYVYTCGRFIDLSQF